MISSPFVKWLRHIVTDLLEHQGFRRYFANTSWMFGEQILRLVTGVLVGIWVARYLGPTQFGTFSYAIAFVSIFTSIAKLGLDGIVVRELVIDPEKRDLYLGTAFWLKFVAALITLCMIGITTLFISNNYLINLYIFIIASGMIFQSFEVVDFYFQAKVLSRLIAISKLTQLFLSSLLKLYLIFSGSGLFWFVIVTFFDQVTLAVTFYIAFRKQGGSSFFSKYDSNIAIKLLKDSWPLILSSLMAMLYLRIDQIMIKEMMGVYEVGLYSVAVKLCEVWYFLPVVISTSLFPAILNAKKHSESLYLKRLQRLYIFSVWSAILIAIPISFFAEDLVSLLFGIQYQKASSVLVIYIWAGVFVFLSAAFGKYLITENFAKINFYRTSCGALLNIVLNYFFIPVYGLKGSAFATIASLFVVNIVYDLFDRKMHGQLKMKINAFVFPWRF